jgi:hypothetical protein
MTPWRLAAAARLIVTGACVVFDLFPQPVKATADMTNVANNDMMKLVFLNFAIDIFLPLKLVPDNQTERRFINETSSTKNARIKFIPSFPNTGGINVSIDTHRPISIG